MPESKVLGLQWSSATDKQLLTDFNIIISQINRKINYDKLYKYGSNDFCIAITDSTFFFIRVQRNVLKFCFKMFSNFLIILLPFFQLFFIYKYVRIYSLVQVKFIFITFFPKTYSTKPFES